MSSMVLKANRNNKFNRKRSKIDEYDSIHMMVMREYNIRIIFILFAGSRCTSILTRTYATIKS